MLSSSQPEVRAAGVQNVAWGAIDRAIALVALIATNRGRSEQQSAAYWADERAVSRRIFRGQRRARHPLRHGWRAPPRARQDRGTPWHGGRHPRAGRLPVRVRHRGHLRDGAALTRLAGTSPTEREEAVRAEERKQEPRPAVEQRGPRPDRRGGLHREGLSRARTRRRPRRSRCAGRSGDGALRRPRRVREEEHRTQGGVVVPVR